MIEFLVAFAVPKLLKLGSPAVRGSLQSLLLLLRRDNAEKADGRLSLARKFWALMPCSIGCD
jgi:hypothetical protein